MNHEDVVTNEDFAAFVYWMAKESSKEDCNWENATLPEFLEALSYFVDGSETGHYDFIGVDMKTLSKWRIFADILWAAARLE
ncbi:hypothetical protein JCM16814_30290 [Desulfobaculum senezii]